MTKTLLLHTSNLAEAITEVASLGGRVTHRLTSNILLSTFPDDFDEQRLQQSTTKIPDNLDENSSLLVRAWRRQAAHTPTDKERETDGLRWDTPGYQHPAVEDGVTHAAAVAARPQSVVNNDQLVGNVAVAIVAVSGSGALSFSDDEYTKLLGQTVQGTQYLANVEPRADVSFSVENYRLTVPGDSQVPGTGMSEAPSIVVFNGKIYCFHQGLGSNGELWYNIFDGNAWLGDVQIPKTGTSDGPSAVVFRGKIYCFHQGLANKGELWFNVFDGTSWAGDTQVPSTGMGQGPSAVVYDDKIYCFHQGYHSNGELWYNVFDGESWAGDIQVRSTGMSAGPSAVLYDNMIYCFHQGLNANGELWYNTFNGSDWMGDTLVPNTGIGDSPSAMVYDDLVYCFHQGPDEDGELFVNIFDGNTWNGDCQLDGIGLTSSPSAVPFNGQMFCLYQGLGKKGELWCRVFEPIGNGQYETYESIWRDPALKQLGVSGGYAGCQQFADQLCQKHGTTRAFIGFFTKFQLTHFAYASIGGVRLCMQYDNDGWTPDNIYKVFAHEVGHIFGAGDEYGDCDCGDYGVYDIANGNCINCLSSPELQVACLMNENTLAMCDFSKGQVGWVFNRSEARHDDDDDDDDDDEEEEEEKFMETGKKEDVEGSSG